MTYSTDPVCRAMTPALKANLHCSLHALFARCLHEPIELRRISMQLDVMLDVKDAFLAQDALVVIVSLVAQPLTRHAEGLMTERDTLIVQLVITFLRNLIVIPDSASRSGASPLMAAAVLSYLCFSASPITDWQRKA